MKIAAGICEYGDTEGLYRCLGSLGLGTGGFDQAIIIHGRFSNFDLKDEDALEQTKAIITRFPKDTIKLIALHGGALSETDSRNLYMKTAAELGYDWLLVIDSDEYLAHKLTDFKEFRRQLQYVMNLGLSHQIFDVQLDGNIPAYHGPQPRLFYRPGTIKYWGRHYWWVLEESMKLYKGQSDAARVIGGIHLLHDHTIRGSEYYTASINYKEWQDQHEGEDVITVNKSEKFTEVKSPFDR